MIWKILGNIFQVSRFYLIHIDWRWFVFDKCMIGSLNNFVTIISWTGVRYFVKLTAESLPSANSTLGSFNFDSILKSTNFSFELPNFFKLSVWFHIFEAENELESPKVGNFANDECLKWMFFCGITRCSTYASVCRAQKCVAYGCAARFG